MKKKTANYLFYAFIASGTFALAYAYLFSSQLRCMLVPISSLEEVAPNIYVEEEMVDEQVSNFLFAVAEAEERLHTFFDPTYAQPVIIAGNSPTVMQTYGMQSSSPGMNHITPFGSYIVLGAEGLNVDVICHELVHAELLARLGWLKREQEIPAWFDEGLALLLDHRYKDTKKTWILLTDYGKKAPSLNELKEMSEFQKYTEISPFLSYVTASLEVDRWWKIVGKEGLSQMIEKLNEGHSFAKAYDAVEQNHIRVGK
ncbi:hypothetical protein R9C00_06400 [Flammeovirgaceae bacterium SG7u.111]|nr:hypothetical protein [Flammeovirgaceae bacterium SG7u.132]WPO37072.1 hypothetical protein R9C00_06400 [Flammeovirgaceae bacterium SG7u.111]